MNYRSLKQLAEVIGNNLHRIPRVDAVVGIPRSGMIAASMIATLTNQALFSAAELFEDLYAWQSRHGGKFVRVDKPWRILLVDDSISGGETMHCVSERLRTGGMRVEALAIYRKANSPAICEAFETVPGPRVFQWNWYRHPLVKRAVLDIDGVLCDEQTKIKDWSDLDHVKAIRDAAKPLFKPKWCPLAYATGRREAERTQTANWIMKNGVPAAQLYMTPDHLDERYKPSGARHTKCIALAETGASWMVESSHEQANYIHKQTKLPVLCIDTNTMLSIL